MAAPFAARADIEARYPREVEVLAADEDTRLVDWARVDAALSDVSAEIRVILQGRYTPAEIGALDEESLGALKLFAIDMALYRVSLSFGRQTEAIKARYDAAVARLEGIAKGRGGLTFVADAGAASALSPSEVLIEAPERVFTRDTMRSF
jgi:phage gp36-like protein